MRPFTTRSLYGTVHFHSTYSHDGRSTLDDIARTLSRRGLAFCIMTEHFEDLSPRDFDRYVAEARRISDTTGFLLIPGVEADVSGLHTMLFPVQDYSETVRVSEGSDEARGRMLRILAHPSKYDDVMILKHLEQHAVDGIELWNQQADGRYLPPVRALELFKSHPGRSTFRYYFGCDIHDVHLSVSNVLQVLLPEGRVETVDAVVEQLRRGYFTSRNLHSGVEFQNGSPLTDFDLWVQGVQKTAAYSARGLRMLRQTLRACYKALPRDMQRSLNTVKNYVRNTV